MRITVDGNYDASFAWCVSENKLIFLANVPQVNLRIVRLLAVTPLRIYNNVRGLLKRSNYIGITYFMITINANDGYNKWPYAYIIFTVRLPVFSLYICHVIFRAVIEAYTLITVEYV